MQPSNSRREPNLERQQSRGKRIHDPFVKLLPRFSRCKRHVEVQCNLAEGYAESGYGKTFTRAREGSYSARSVRGRPSWGGGPILTNAERYPGLLFRLPLAFALSKPLRDELVSLRMVARVGLDQLHRNENIRVPGNVHAINDDPMRRSSPVTAGQQRGFEAERFVNDVINVADRLSALEGPLAIRHDDIKLGLKLFLHLWMFA